MTRIIGLLPRLMMPGDDGDKTAAVLELVPERIRERVSRLGKWAVTRQANEWHGEAVDCVRDQSMFVAFLDSLCNAIAESEPTPTASAALEPYFRGIIDHQARVYDLLLRSFSQHPALETTAAPSCASPAAPTEGAAVTPPAYGVAQ